MDTTFLLDTYLGNANKIEQLRSELYQSIFLKTNIDVVYTDIINWEKYDLLAIDFDVPPLDEAYKKTAICFMDYLWIKTVEQLRRYGFSYDDIRLIKDKVGKKYYFKDIYLDIKSNRKMYENTDNKNLIQKADEMAKKGSLSSNSFVTLFEQFVIQTIIKKWELKLLFFKEYPGEVFPFTKDILNSIEKRGMEEATSFYLQLDHFSFSFYKLLIPFLTNGETAFDIHTVVILTSKEQKLINLIRRNYSSVKSITIHFANTGMTYIDITSQKKADIEGRIMDYIKKGDYGSIKVQTTDGKIVNFEKTEKHKL
jgi:hypothetical protein